MNIRERERAEERAIMRMMDAIEADACRIFEPYADEPRQVVRVDKIGHGQTPMETVQMRLSRRKYDPLPIEDDPIRVGPSADPYGQIRYNGRGGFRMRSQGQRFRRQQERLQNLERGTASKAVPNRTAINTRIAQQRWKRQRETS